MAVPSPAEADAATVRVRLVADMLLQKAQEVQSKGNAGAAHSLSESAADLQRAAALLLELARLVHLPPARLRSDSDASFSSFASNDGTSSMSSISVSASGPTSSRGGPPGASRSVKDLVAKLSRVDVMLGKKSDEMRQKGNENAAHALHQSALAVRSAVQHIADQQLMTRTLVVTARALREQLREHCRLLLTDDEITDETTVDDELTRRALESVRELAAMRAVLREIAPETTSADQLRDLLQRVASVDAPTTGPTREVERLSAETTRLQQQLTKAEAQHARELRDAHDATENIRIQCEALEKALKDLESEYHERRERELAHLNALHERQKDTHEELKKLLLAKQEEVTALKLQADAWMNQFTQLQDTMAELQAQREHDDQFHNRQVGELRDQVHARDTEMRGLREELRRLHEQLLEQSSSPGTDDHQEQIVNELRQQLKAVETRRDALVVEVEKARLQVDAVEKDYQARLQEAEQSARVTAEERDVRIAELEGALASVPDRANDTQREQELKEELDQLRRDLDGDCARCVELEQQYEEASVALATAQKELDTCTQELALVRQDQATRSTGMVAREKALEMELQEKDEALARLTAAAQDSKNALSAAQAEQAATSQHLHDAQNEVAAVREEFTAWKRELIIVAQDVCGETDSLTEDASSDQVTTVLHRRYSQLLGELKGSKKRCEELMATHETEVAQLRETTQAELTELQARHEELRSSVDRLEREKSLVEAKYETLQTAQLASAEANGAKLNESDELKKKLLEVETDFERYRTRSHAALKKVEKRAELLNTMRKENESLTKAIAEREVAHDAAVEKEALATARLDEVARKLVLCEEQSAQQIQDAQAKLEEAEQQCAVLAAEMKELEEKYNDATAKVALLQEDKEDLARAKHAVHEQALELKCAELEGSKKRLEEAEAALAELEEKCKSVKEEATALRDEQIALLERERQALSDAEARAKELEQSRNEMTARVEQLTMALDEKQREMASVVASRDAAKVEAMPSSVENESRRETHELVELRAKLHDATRETEQLTARLVEIQLTKVAAEQEAEQLRTLVVSLKSDLANAAMATPSSPSDELAALQAAQHAQEAKVLHLLNEIEMMTKRQLDDQLTISDLNEQLQKSEQGRSEVEERLRLAQEHQRAGQASAPTEMIGTRVLEASGQTRQESNGDEDATADPTDDLSLLQASRKAKREQHEKELEMASRKKRVDEYVQKTADVVRELQQTMDDYSSVFRDACALRDQEDKAEDDVGNGHGEDADAEVDSPDQNGAHQQEYEEYLTLTSGVVVKAGATFSLPVFCDKPGGRVEWKFVVKEDGADVGFALSVETTPSDGSAAASETIVAPERVNELSGVYDVTTATIRLRFDWDNSFSWLNVKTLDYHVSVLQPLSKSKQALRTRQRSIERDILKIDERLALLREEKEKREQLETARHHFDQCADDKRAHVAAFVERREAIQEARTALQTRMEELQAQLRGLVTELDDVTTGERAVTAAWEALQSEHEDVDMTVQLSANSRLDELRQSLETKRTELEGELVTVTSALAHE
jgi:chromosome segregation ATPase